MNNDILIRDWAARCPYLTSSVVSRNGKLEYGIYPSPVNIRYHENVLGENVPDDIQVTDFILTAKRTYTSQNTSSYVFYQSIIEWINTQNMQRRFPKINEGIVTSVIPTLTQYVSEPNRHEERCQIQIQVTYKRFS